MIHLASLAMIDQALARLNLAEVYSLYASEMRSIKSLSNVTDEAKDNVAKVCIFEPTNISSLMTSVRGLKISYF